MHCTWLMNFATSLGPLLGQGPHSVGIANLASQDVQDSVSEATCLGKG